MSSASPSGSTSGASGSLRVRSITGPALAVLASWALMLYLAPLAVGLAVGAIPLRLTSSGILFDQVAVTLNGYRLIVWSPVLTGLLLTALALKLPPSRVSTTLGIAGAALAGTMLVAGGLLGIGPGSTLLVGTELRWVWKLCAGAGGLAVGLVGTFLIRARAEDHALDFPALKRDILISGVVLGVVILLAAPGPLLGKTMTGVGSWLGSLVWVLGL